VGRWGRGYEDVEREMGDEFPLRACSFWLGLILIHIADIILESITVLIVRSIHHCDLPTQHWINPHRLEDYLLQCTLLAS
jgi:hypothetical protein